VTGRISLGCALLAILLGACRPTLVLDDLAPDGGRSGTGGTRVGPSDASSDGRCPTNQSALLYTADIPQVLIALDRSAAMSAPFGTNETQFGAALNAIQSEVSSYSGAHNSRRNIQFAFLDFPDLASDCNGASGCCPSDVIMSYSDFEQANACNDSGPNSCFQLPNRPTATALSKAYDYYDMYNGGSQRSNERYVLLVTDDDPQGSCPNNSAACSSALTQVNSLSSIGVSTEVVAIGTGAPCLTELANEQGMFPSPYYVASTPNDLPGAIDGVMQMVAQGSCRLTLSSATSGHLTVVFNNVIQPQDNGTTGNGWNYGGDNNTRVYLHGTLCQSFLQGTQGSPFGLQIYDGCVPDHLAL
jgi:hypothetical protein